MLELKKDLKSVLLSLSRLLKYCATEVSELSGKIEITENKKTSDGKKKTSPGPIKKPAVKKAPVKKAAPSRKTEPPKKAVVSKKPVSSKKNAGKGVDVVPGETGQKPSAE